MKTDDDWLATLAGRPPAGADPEVVQEARRLREAMVEDLARRAGADRAAEGRLVARLRREGRLPAHPWWPGPLPLALAASLVLGLMMVRMMMPPGVAPTPAPETPGFKEIALPQRLTAPNPAARAQALAAGLRRFGLGVTERGEGAGWTLEAQVAPPGPAGLAAWLASQGLYLPADGDLLVMVTPLGPPGRD
jgi:hypothetical protein